MTSCQPSRNARVALALAALFVATAAAPPLLTIDGSVSGALTAADLAAMPRASLRWIVHGRTMSCSGPWLADVLARAGVPSGEAVRGAALTTLVVGTAADGYRAAFTLGELAHSLGNARVIVADTCDGQPLAAADGPLRVVAATDKRGARGTPACAAVGDDRAKRLTTCPAGRRSP